MQTGRHVLVLMAQQLLLGEYLAHTPDLPSRILVLDEGGISACDLTLTEQDHAPPLVFQWASPRILPHMFLL